MKPIKIAIIIPCYNEGISIAKVIDDFRHELPEADIYVYDNNSTDNTIEIAQQHGAIIKKEYRQGKGNVVRSMFREIEADIYIMTDGDDTYPALSVHNLIEPVINGQTDMAVGDRHSSGAYKNKNTRALHNFGNHLVTKSINVLFNANLHDIMSGYRVFNRKFVKNMAINSNGFEIETEMTLHCLDKKFTLSEIPIDYQERPEGSYSKLNTFSDGAKILKTIFWIFKDYKPLAFFSILSFFFFTLGLLTGIPVIIEFIQTAYVTKVPSAILSIGLILISVLSLFSGFILDTIVKLHRERYELNLINYITNSKTRI